MAFNSVQFLLFFPIVLCLYFLLPYRFRRPLLLIAGLYFYIAWRPPFVLLFLAAILVGYYAGLRIQEADTKSRKKAYLVTSILLLVGNLFVFKYLNFFSDSLRSLLELVKLSYVAPTLHLLLPIGISFYTFQLLSYVIDVYKEKIEAERNLGIFAAYVSFFRTLSRAPSGALQI